MIPLLLLCALSATAEDAATDRDYRSHVDQARFFLKKSWHNDAAEQLELAVESEDGKLDPEAWFLLASVRYQLADLSGAREAADRAIVHSRSDDQTSQAQELLRFLDDQFGLVELSSSRPGVAARVHIELTGLLIDPQLKAYFGQLTDRLEDKVTLPFTVGLPAGAYAINGQEIEVAPGSPQRLQLRPGGAASLQSLDVDASFGVQTLLGDAVSSNVPIPQLELGVSQPLGVVFFGAMATWSIQPVPTMEGLLVSPTGWSAGAKVGLDLGGDSAFTLRPAIAGRVVSLPGIQLACTEAPVASCVRDTASAESIGYARGTGGMVGGELAARLGDRTRRRGLGAGLKTSLDGLWGQVPSEGVFLTAEDAPPQRYRLANEDQSWSALGIRVHFTVSYFF